MRIDILICFSLCFGISSLTCQNFVWAKKVSSDGIDEPQSMVLDKSGNVYTIGYFEDTCDFDPGPASFTMAPSAGFDVFILKLDSTGNFIWAIKTGGVSYISMWHQAVSIAIDSSDNIYATGFFDGTVDMDPGPGTYTLSEQGQRDVFVTKLTSGGNLVWARQLGGPGFDFASSICIDPSGNIITSGYFYSTADFDPGPGTFTLSASVNYDCFISKLDNNGNFIWAKSFSGTSEGHAIVSNKYGDLFCTGTFFGTVDFDPSSATYLLSSGTNSTAEAFIVKLNASGNLVWAKKMGGFNSPDDGYVVGVDKSGNVYSGGTFTGIGDFDPGPGTFTLSSAAGFEDIFLLKLDSLGNFLWVKQFGGTDYECLYAMKIDTASNIYLAGGFMSGNMDFDPGPVSFTMTPNGGSVSGPGDIFVLKLTQSGVLAWAVQMGGKGPDGALAMAIDGIGNVYNAGTFSADQFADFNPGPGQYIMQSQMTWPQDAFITRLSGHCFIPTQPVANPPLNFCLGSNGIISASSTGAIAWHLTSTSAAPFSTAPSIAIYTGVTGTQTYFAEALGCMINPVRTQITVTVSALPDVSASFSPSPFCQGDFPIVTAHGAKTYSWQGGSQTSTIQIGPPYNSSYIVTGIDSLGCRKQISVSPLINECVRLPEVNQETPGQILFPNPATDHLILSGWSLQDGANYFCIYDQFARKIKKLELIFHHGTTELSIKDLSNGVYFLRPQDPDQNGEGIKFTVFR